MQICMTERLEKNMPNKPLFAVEYAYTSFTSYYYYGGRVYLGFTAKGCKG